MEDHKFQNAQAQINTADYTQVSVFQCINFLSWSYNRKKPLSFLLNLKLLSSLIY